MIAYFSVLSTINSLGREVIGDEMCSFVKKQKHCLSDELTAVIAGLH
jgi:hypothetical protein